MLGYIYRPKHIIKHVHTIEQQQSRAQLSPRQNKVAISFVYEQTRLHLREPIRPLATVIQYIPRNLHTVFALLCFVVVIHWLIFPYPSGLLHWHCGNLTIAPVPAKQPWWIWINTLCEFIMNDCTTTTKQSTTKPCAYFLGYTVYSSKQCPDSTLSQSRTNAVVEIFAGWILVTWC